MTTAAATADPQGGQAEEEEIKGCKDQLLAPLTFAAEGRKRVGRTGRLIGALRDLAKSREAILNERRGRREE
jgi:hypothetical protein